MPLLARTILTPLTIEISSGAIDRLGSVLSDARISNGQVGVVIGSGIGPQVRDRVAASLPDADFISIDAGTLASASALADKLKAHSYDAVVGIGGGKVIDTVKYAATQQGLPMVAVATSLAHDGLASPVATLERDGAHPSYGVHIPIAVIVDLALIARSPDYRIRSGIGDALSNLSAVADWELSHEITGEPVDGLAMGLSRTGAQAVLHHPGTIGDTDFLATLANALILGGVSMAVAGSSRPCSGACHEITHAFTSMYPTAVSHGIGAGIGALFATYLRATHPDVKNREAIDLFDHLNAAFKRHRLPRTPVEIDLTPGQFAAVVQQAPATRPGRFTILEHLRLDEGQIAKTVEEYIVAAG